MLFYFLPTCTAQAIKAINPKYQFGSRILEEGGGGGGGGGSLHMNI